MIYVSHVKSSMKDGCDVDLGPRTVIVGPNGSGKTTIVQSIELATRGQVSDMEGRELVKQHTALARLFPADAESMFAEVDVQNGSGAPTPFSWSMERGARAGFKKPVHSPPFDVRFPVQELTATIKGDEASVAAWLEGQVIGELTTDDLLSALPPAVRGDAKAFISRQDVTDFLALAQKASQESKNLKTKATRDENTIDKLTEGIAPPLLEHQVISMTEERKGLNAPSGVTQAAYDQAKAKVDAMIPEFTELRDEVDGLDPLDPKTKATVQRLAAIKTLIATHGTAFGDERCMVCGNAEEGAITAQLGRLKVAEDSLRPAVISEGVRTQKEAYRDVLWRNLQSKAAQLKSLVVVGEDTSAARRSEIDNALASDRASRKVWNNAEATRKEIDQLRARADKLALVGKALKKAGTKMLTDKKASFESQVSCFLPGSEELGVDLKSGRLGLVRSEQLHSALSGAEESRVLMALASAQESGSTPCVLVPKDRGWDRDTLASVMEALAESPVQVIIMSTVKPEPVEGWKVVDLTP